MRDELEEIAKMYRDHLLRRIAKWATAMEMDREGVVPTKDFCKTASHGLQEVLSLQFPDGAWRIAGGWGVGQEPIVGKPGSEHLDTTRWPGGLRDVDGRYQGHFWVAGTLDGTPIVVDVTADQFGHPEVVVGDGGDLYRENLVDPLAEFTFAERHWADWIVLDVMDVLNPPTPGPR